MSTPTPSTAAPGVFMIAGVPVSVRQLASQQMRIKVMHERGPRAAAVNPEGIVTAYLAPLNSLDGAVMVSTLLRGPALDDQVLLDDWQKSLQFWLERLMDRAAEVVAQREGGR